MKRLSNYILFVIVLCFSNMGKAQELTIMSDKQECTLNDTLYISISIKSIEAEPCCHLKPDIENIKFGLMAFVLKSQNSKNEYVYFLEDGGDIDEITLTCDNSILLGKNESFTKEIPISLKEFSPMLNEVGTYSLCLLIDYSIVDFKVDCCQKKNVFKGKLKTELEGLKLK